MLIFKHTIYNQNSVLFLIYIIIRLTEIVNTNLACIMLILRFVVRNINMVLHTATKTVCSQIIGHSIQILP